MIQPTITDSALRRAAAAGMDAFVDVFVEAINTAIGGELTAENMGELNNEQLTLLAYHIMQKEVMDGGFVQLIHNGYGGFIFKNPLGRMMRLWGLDSLATLLNKARKLYYQYHEEIERDCTDEEFAALYEQYPAFDDVDDTFVENEEKWTAEVARHIDDNIEDFCKVEQ